MPNPDTTISALDPNGRAVMTAISAAVLFIRELSPDPAERLRLIKQCAVGMSKVVNDPTWGSGFLSVETKNNAR